MELRKTFRFEASHILPKHKGKCSRLHGHSWVLHVFVEGYVNKETGFVKDYADISAEVKPMIEDLDHKHLGWWYAHVPFNEAWSVPWLPKEFYPSSENLLWAVGKYLHRDGLDWSKLQLEETCTSLATLEKTEFLLGIGEATMPGMLSSPVTDPTV